MNRITETIANVASYFDMQHEVEDFDRIHTTIEKDIIFKGTNLWILVFAIIIASVGLNMNSTAVIIGAMLISPLMGPINGMGYSIATYNFPLLRKAIKNFSFAVGAGLVTSTLYFLISPVSTAHSELLARTSPTIYDVLIALFGGLAGVVAISSRQKGNVIPGVAIATALMPPLCTAGYGLATAQFNFFFGAIYLFTINTVFIALSSVVFSQVFKFPIITIVDASQKSRINRIISAVIAVTILPSIYFGYGLVQKERFNENALRFIKNVNVFEGNYLLDYEVNTDSKEINLVYAGRNLNAEQKEAIREKAQSFEIQSHLISFKQGLVLDEASVQSNSEIESLKSQLKSLSSELSKKQSRLDSLEKLNKEADVLTKEMAILFPFVKSITLSQGTKKMINETNAAETFEVVAILQGNFEEMNDTKKDRIKAWLQTRLELAKKPQVVFLQGK